MYTERVTLVVDAAGEERLVRFLSGLDGLLAGVQADRGNVSRQFQIRLGNALLEKISEDLIKKAAGGAGSDGRVWKKLAESTIARRKMSRPELKAMGIPRSRYEKYKRGTLGAGESRALRYLLGNRVVEILRDTGALFKYLQPNASPDVLPTTGTMTIDPGKVVIEVTDERKKWHHEGTKRGLPERRLWPIDGLPSSYWERMLDSGLQGLVRALALTISGGRF